MNNISSYMILIIIMVILLTSIKEKEKTFSKFVLGCKEGLKILYEIYPILLGMFVSISMLRLSGVIKFAEIILRPLTYVLKIPEEILPILILRPISGSGTMAVAINLIKKYGVDSFLGLSMSMIMGSTETTLYVLSVYTKGKKYKNSWQVLLVGLIGDLVGIVLAVRICSFLT